MTDRSTIIALVREACHGAGAAPRWEARDRLAAIAEAEGFEWDADLLRHHGLDVAVYFASRPISRPAPREG